CAERSRRAQAAGAAMVMIMPPYHGATIRAGERAMYDFFRTVSDAIDIPIMIQDAPVSGTPLPAALLARMAQEIPNVAYFKIETPGAAAKLREMIRLGGEAIEGPWDGEEAITLLPDLDAGATGTMSSGAYPDALRRIMDDYAAGRRDEAVAGYERLLPLINYENRQCGLLACKVLMKEGGVIASDAVRHPLLPLHPAIRAGLLEIAGRLEPLVLRWGM
ncbi:MAG: dihydrodipicolinate synthase family protein, partial [Pseudomonadota bacterium]|nr:dihydrodipicolinate synthase family protein [Pseudomonadota bacterium]